MTGSMTQEDWDKFYAQGEPTGRGNSVAWTMWFNENRSPLAVEIDEREAYIEFLKKHLGVTYEAWLKNARVDL